MLSVRADLVPVQLATAGVDVNLVQAQPPRPLPDEAEDPEGDDDREGKVGLEEALGVVDARLARGSDGGEELRVVSILMCGPSDDRGGESVRTWAARTTTHRIRPIQDPQTPKMAWKGISSREWP